MRFASGESIVRYEPAPPMAGTTGEIEALSMWAGQGRIAPLRWGDFPGKSWHPSGGRRETSRHLTFSVNPAACSRLLAAVIYRKFTSSQGMDSKRNP